MILVSSCSCLCSIYWSQVLSREWRCSWSSAGRRCSNYIWVISNFITYWGAPYIRGLTVIWNGAPVYTPILEDKFFCSVLFFYPLISTQSLLMPETEYSGFGVNTMPADALAPKVARISAGMVLLVYEREHLRLLHRIFGLLLLNKIQDMVQNMNISSIIFKTIQHVPIRTTRMPAFPPPPPPPPRHTIAPYWIPSQNKIKTNLQF